MYSYIEIDENLSFPSSSNVGKMVFGVNDVKQATLTNESGVTTIIGGGTGSIVPDSVNYKAYAANLSESQPDYWYSGNLIVGETYKITDYYLGDDFSNVANVQSGTINSNGCIFIATGITPNSWGSGTELLSSGKPRVNNLGENTLGFTPEWLYKDQGIYTFNFSESIDYNRIVPYISPNHANLLGSTVQLNYSDLSFLDETFNVGTGFDYGSGFDSDVYAITRQSNGKILVGGQFATYGVYSCNYICRLNTDGTFDNSFDIGSGFDSNVRAIAIQADGKIIVGGEFSQFNSAPIPFGICRLNTDGTLDDTFNYSGGFGGGFDQGVNSIAIQSDGKIVVGGYFYTYDDVINGTTSMNCLIRLNTDGTYDTTFNNGYPGFAAGKITSFINSIAIQSDGKIVCGGTFVRYDDTNGFSLSRSIARLNTDGTFDISFLSYGSGYGFIDSTSLNGIGILTSIALQSDGKIICGGKFDQYQDGTGLYSINNIARLNTDGTFDTTFVGYGGGGGGFDNVVNSITVRPNDYILVGGAFSGYSNGIETAILQNIAELDLDGNFVGFNLHFDSEVYAICYQQDDAKVVVGGNFTDYDGTGANYIIRLKGDASIDIVRDFDSGTYAGNVFTTAVQPDGKIIIGGDFYGYNDNAIPRKYAINRLNSDGYEDLTFDVGTGFVNGAVLSLALQSDGKIVCIGDIDNFNGTPIALRIARIDATGSLDTTFNTNAGTGFSAKIYALAIQPDEKILVGGGSLSDYNGTAINGICRLNTDGTLDTIFNNGGSGFSNKNFVNSIAIQTDGKIICGGDIDTYNGTAIAYFIMRLNSDGTLDTTFNTNANIGFNSQVYSLAIQSDGKILVGGDFTTYNDINDTYSPIRIARLNADGTFDTTFNSGGSGFNDYPEIITIQPDDSILVGGNFTDYNGTPLSYLVRLDKDGNILNDFYSFGGGLDGNVSSISIYPNNKIIIGGGFTGYDGTETGRSVLRLFAAYDVALITQPLSGKKMIPPLDNLLNKTPVEIRLYN